MWKFLVNWFKPFQTDARTVIKRMYRYGLTPAHIAMQFGIEEKLVREVLHL